MKKSKATEALRVATDIAAIRAVLKKRGYTIRFFRGESRSCCRSSVIFIQTIKCSSRHRRQEHQLHLYLTRYRPSELKLLVREPKQLPDQLVAI
ncbi:MAG: hypothetical protein AB1589_24445 [Cyanobacteriota bacterium]